MVSLPISVAPPEMTMRLSPYLISFLLEYLNNLVHATAVDIAEELLQRVQNPRFPEFEAFFGVSFTPCNVGRKFVCQWKDNI
jgi:hypothetical protein